MTAAERLLQLTGKELKVWKLPNGEIAVRFQDCEVKDGIFLKSEFGSGQTFESACIDYIENIRGKILVFHARNPRQREEIRV